MVLRKHEETDYEYSGEAYAFVRDGATWTEKWNKANLKTRNII